MKNFRFCGLLLAMIWLPAAGLSDTVAPVRSLEGVVGQWVELREQADLEERAWKAQKAQWLQETELLAQEQAKLATALATLEEVGETRQERGAELLARRARLTVVLAEVDATLTRLQPALSAMSTQVPAALMTDTLSSALNVKTSAPVEPMGGGARLQRMLGALKTLEELQGGIHTTREMITLPKEPRREMNVIYFGLVCGFAVTTDGTSAAAGHPVSMGWTWEAAPALASNIRKLQRIANQDEPPALMSFPVASGMDPSIWCTERADKP